VILPVLKQNLSAVNDSQQLVDLSLEAGVPISLAAANVMASGIELLDDDQLDQVTGGSVLLAGIGLATALVGLASAVFSWMESNNNLQTAKINAGIITA